MQNPTIRLVDNSTYEINLKSEELRKHFGEPQNYTGAILDQFNTRNYYEDFVDENDKTIVDLGANIGLFAIHVAPYAKRIVCFEPTPSHFNLLKQLTEEFSNIELVEAAIAPSTGPIKFYTEPSNTTMNSLVNRGGYSFEVKGYSLKDIAENFDLKNIDFLKMDIEGSEDFVLNEETLNYMFENIPKVLIEFHNNYHTDTEKYKAIFESRGFVVKKFIHDSIMCIKKK